MRVGVLSRKKGKVTSAKVGKGKAWHERSILSTSLCTHTLTLDRTKRNETKRNETNSHSVSPSPAANFDLHLGLISMRDIFSLESTLVASVKQYRNVAAHSQQPQQHTRLGSFPDSGSRLLQSRRLNGTSRFSVELHHAFCMTQLHPGTICMLSYA